MPTKKKTTKKTAPKSTKKVQLDVPTKEEINKLPKVSSFTIVSIKEGKKDMFQVVEVITQGDFVLEVKERSELLASRPDVANTFKQIILTKVIRPLSS